MAHNVVETSRIRKSQDIHHHAYINQYELVAALGEGMHGRVMLARDSKTHERVAIKIMRRINPMYRRLPRSTRLAAPRPSAQQETESKIRREIAVMKKCTHQNLVRLREVIDDPASKKVYLVMENLEGGEVKWRSKSFDEPVLQLPQVQRILRDVTLGLEYLHHQGIIHRDIKPANLLWTQDRQSVKICDFGVSHFTAAAVAADQDPNLYDEAGLTKTAGSPAFFAPEICHTPNISFDDPTRLRHGSTSPTPLPTFPPITKQIDIWALGVTFYCLLFGTPPWQGQTEFAMFRAICNDDFHIPDTMCSDRVPTGGKRRGPQGKHIGWCVVGLLEGLLEKDQDRRITLDHIKRIPWIQEGVRDPGRWLRETAPD
ncbi:kinase-like domain-containing protein, partial [Gautieria morchelliformis]